MRHLLRLLLMSLKGRKRIFEKETKKREAKPDAGERLTIEEWRQRVGSAPASGSRVISTTSPLFYLIVYLVWGSFIFGYSKRNGKFFFFLLPLFLPCWSLLSRGDLGHRASSGGCRPRIFNFIKFFCFLLFKI